MHKMGRDMAYWAMSKAKECGYDNLTSQDWDDLKDCLEAAHCAICIDKAYREVEAMSNDAMKMDKKETIHEEE